MELGRELQAAFMDSNYQRVLMIMAANSKHKGNIEEMLDDWADHADYVAEYEPRTMVIEGCPVRVLGVFSVAVVEYLDGMRRGVYRGDESVFQEAMKLIEKEYNCMK